VAPAGKKKDGRSDSRATKGVSTLYVTIHRALLGGLVLRQSDNLRLLRVILAGHIPETFSSLHAHRLLKRHVQTLQKLVAQARSSCIYIDTGAELTEPVFVVGASLDAPAQLR